MKAKMNIVDDSSLNSTLSSVSFMRFTTDMIESIFESSQVELSPSYDIFTNFLFPAYLFKSY